MSKILPTIGPATESKKNINKILKYSNLVRINGAHNTLEWHKRISNLIKKKSDTKILLDLPGVKPRTNNIKIHKIKKNQQVVFFHKKCKIKKILKIETAAGFPKISKKAKNFSLCDGKYIFKIKKMGKNFIVATSTENFDLDLKKGINLPHSVYNEKNTKKFIFVFFKKNKRN